MPSEALVLAPRSRITDTRLGEQLIYLNPLGLVLPQKKTRSWRSIIDGMPRKKTSKQMFKHPLVLTTIGLITAIASQAAA
jgi:hypothetical protein